MESTLWVLCLTAASVGFAHTILGPDHYLPFVVMAKARGWNIFKTIWITFTCGLGHVLSSVVIGVVGIAMGVGVGKLENIEAFRGDIAAWALFIFGLVYLFWGLWRVYLMRPHKHKHIHDDGIVHEHKHSHSHGHGHLHKYEKGATLTPWILFVVFVLGPCEVLIPILMYPAAKLSTGGIVLVSLVFSIATIATMITTTILIIKGINFFKPNILEKYTHAIAGAAISISAAAILFLGL